MRQKRLKFSAVLLFGLGIIGIQAQEAIPVSGGNASGSGGSASYTIGQMVYTTNNGTSGTVAEGVQQPFEILVETGIDEAIGINLICTVYPNPTSGFLILEVKDFELSNLHFQLYDINGKLLQNQKIASKQIFIDMINFVPSTYFVKVLEANKEVKTFKIIKN